jgi:hypothetical protein
MAKQMPKRTLQIEIDASLATRYRSAYKRAFGSDNDSKQGLEEFMAGFVEDRLAEELEFAEDEAR